MSQLSRVVVVRVFVLSVLACVLRNRRTLRSTVHSALVAVFLLCAATANASTFTFSYTLHSPNVVSGSFLGVQNGEFVDDITDVTVLLNGQPLVGSPHMFGFGFNVVTHNLETIPAIVSFDGLKNNFFFIDTSYLPAVRADYTNYFIFYNDKSNPIDVTLVQVHTPYFSGNDASDIRWVGVYDTFDPSRWTLTAEPPFNSPVPEPASLFLLGTGLISVAMRRCGRRRRHSKPWAQWL